MAAGRIHDSFNRTLNLPTSISAGILTYYFSRDLGYSFQIGAVTYVGLQIGRYLTPDQDQNNANFCDFLAELFDPWLGKILYWIFWPYGLLFNHRSVWTHGIVIGALIRLAYSFLVFSPIIALLELHKYMLEYWDFTLCFVLSIIISDIFHILLDYTPLRQVAENIWRN